MSHHVRNLLQGISGGNHLIEEALQSQCIDQIEDGWRLVSQKQEELASTLLDCLALFDSPSPDRRPTDLNGLLDELVGSMQKIAMRHRVRIVFAPREQPHGIVPVDPVLLGHAISNLLTASINSCRNHSEGRIELHFESSLDADDIRIEIRDNGARLDRRLRQNLFDPGVYAEQIGTTGLSLAVSRQLIESLGGRLTVNNNRGPGKHFLIQLADCQD